MTLVSIVFRVRDCKKFVELLIQKGYQKTGECFHPLWNREWKGEIYSAPVCPIFWICEQKSLPPPAVFMWFGPRFFTDGIIGNGFTAMIGSETFPIPKREAKALIKNLKEILGKALQVRHEPKSSHGWRGWARFWKGERFILSVKDSVGSTK